MKQNKISLNSILIFLSIFIFFIISISNSIADNDTLFHIKIGEWIVQNKQLPSVDMFSMHHNLNLSYSAYAYLFDIVVYFFYAIFGIQGMVVLKYSFWIIFLITSIFIIKKLSIDNKNYVSIIFMLVLTTIEFTFYNIRPAMPSYLIMVIQLYIMNRWAKNQDSKIIYWIPLTFLVLNNFHIGVFLFHLFVVCAFGLELFIKVENDEIKFKNFFRDKNFYKCLIVMGLSLLTLLLTPNGLKVVGFSFNTVAAGTTKYNSEWQPVLISVVPILISLTAIFIKLTDFRKIPITNIFNLIICFIFAVKSYRFVPYFVIVLILLIPYCSFPKMKISVPEIFKKVFNKGTNKIIFSITIFIVSVFLLYFNIISGNIGVKWDFNDEKAFVNNPVNAVEYMKENNITTNLYNHYDIGGYLLFNDIEVFIDARCDLYSKYFNEFEDNVSIIDDFIDVALENTKSFKYLMDKYNLEYALLMDYEFFLLDSLDNYEILYEDEESKVIRYFGHNNS